jgi:hypothetical protein
LFGHHSLSETSFGTDSIDLFFTPTGLAGTGATFTNDITVNASSNLAILTKETVLSFTGLGTAPVLGFDGLEFTIAKAEEGIARLSVENQSAASASLAAASVQGNIFFQSEATDKLLKELESVQEFKDSDSFSNTAAQNTANRPLFGAMVATLGSFHTTNVSLQATSEIGRVLVWGNVEISQDPSYTANTSDQNASYSQVQPSQTPSYSEVEPSQTPSHTEIKPTQTPTWNT